MNVRINGGCVKKRHLRTFGPFPFSDIRTARDHRDLGSASNNNDT